MNHPAIVLLILVAAVIVAAVLAYSFAIRRRSKLLRTRFGPEYDRVLKQEKSVHRAEGVLEFRQQARETLQIRPLSRKDQVNFTNRWSEIQRDFVDDPRGAVLRADQLINEAMEARGYPVASFDQRADIISVDYPVVVQNYRAGHQIAEMQRKGQASTEDLRKAMVHYRSLFDELVNDSYSDIKKEAHG